VCLGAFGAKLNDPEIASTCGAEPVDVEGSMMDKLVPETTVTDEQIKDMTGQVQCLLQELGWVDEGTGDRNSDNVVADLQTTVLGDGSEAAEQQCADNADKITYDSVMW